jgi:hypothetical protein
VMQSTNIAAITPQPQVGTIWTWGYYYDANVFVAITPSVQADVSFQVTAEKYADALWATNSRGEIALHYFF